MLRTALPKLAQIQHPVRDRVDAVVDEIRRIVLTDFPPIEQINEYLQAVRGKMFRPTLLLLCDSVCDRGSPKAATLGAAVELVHLATLVHDDAVDHSILRRGMPTVNALWNHQTAVIMGDYLYSRSVSELALIGRIEYLQVLARAANEMSIGEMRQLTSCEKLDYTEAEYYRLIASKTASLMSAACEIGALSGCAEHRESLARYGHYLGMAFQITDDLLDYTGSEDVTGKPGGQDLREHKVTLPLITALERMGEAAQGAVRDFFADPEPTAGGIEHVIELVVEHEGLEAARREAQEYGERARVALADLPESDATEALHLAVDYVTDRRR